MASLRHHLTLVPPASDRPSALALLPVDHAGYEPERVLSSGRDGVALVARDPRSGDAVELRLLSPSMHASDRAVVARRLALLSPVATPGVRSILSFDLDADTAVVALAPAVGDPLGAFCRAQGAVASQQVAAAFERLAAALAEVHRLSFAHGDLRPETVTYDRDGVLHVELTGLRVDRAVSDWGRACVAPDPAGGAPADVYALGALALGALTGGDPSAGLADPDGLRAVIERALLPDPDERPGAAAWARELRRWRNARARAAAGAVATLAFDPPRAAVPSSRPAAAAATLSFEDAPSGAPPPAAVDLVAGAGLGRYTLERRLGEGGMGEAWAARDLATGATVAVKVLRARDTGDPVFLQRFRREARMLAAVRNPYIANFIDLNEDRGVHYLVMEFVPGVSLGKWLRARGRLAEREALAVAADACRALREPHRAGIVHRDIKPDNLLLVDPEPPAPDDLSRQRVKLCDFGIARRDLDHDATQQVTREGGLVGTPMYMSPEQCRGLGVHASADVYALGCTLFECLTGRPPFDRGAVVDVMLQHVHAPPPSVRDERPELSEATASLVARCLAKEPSDRYADATELLAALEAILHGEPAAVELHPALPPGRPGWTRRFVFEWELAASPERLWPVVADTDGMNRAAGFAPVRYDLQAVAPGVSERFGESSALGIPLRWRELPYEWVEGRRHAVFRAFERGVLQWYSAEVTLDPIPGGGTRVRHVVTVEPRGWLGYLASPIEVGVRYRRALDRIYRRVEALAAAPGALARSLQAPVELAPGGGAALARARDAAVARGADPAAAEAVVAHLAEAADVEVARVRPFALAAARGLAPDAVADACLVLAREGALDLLWDVICPSCQAPSNLVESLAAIRAHERCPACNLDFELDFARSVELVFRAAPAVRAVETRTFCAAGPGRAPHVVAQLRLAPGERLDLALALGEGAYRVRSAQLAWAYELRVERASTRARAELLFAAGGPAASRPFALQPGEQRLALRNGLDAPLLLRVERARDERHCLTAARASTMRRFRELFGDQVLAPGALVSLASVTLVCVAARDVAALCRALGDAEALARLLGHFRALEDLGARHRGALVKTVASRAVLAFERPEDAVAFAIALRDEGGALPASVAVHRGAVVAATLGDRLDYFGQHAELAFELPRFLDEATTFLTQAVASDEGVRALLEARAARLSPGRVRAAGVVTWGVIVA